MPIQIMLGDITEVDADAWVNAANPSLLGGSGVDGAIHKAAGGELVNACYMFKELQPGIRCPPGIARITPGFKARVKWIIHTVGPVWHGGNKGEAETLANCYRNSFQLAQQHNVQSIVFPAISCGVYGFPWAQAAEIALREAKVEVAARKDQLKVTFCCFAEEIYKIYRAAHEIA
ncbi:MAG: macro domain-containing protein [Xanthomonadales bacterium]|nr:macro domain-containing protein [Xanthomonadales bacterium]